MNGTAKREFLALLKNALLGLPEQEIRESLNFYNEMISDGIEEGLSEEEAVGRIGSVSQIAAQIKAEKSAEPSEAPEPTVAKRRLSAMEITLLILGSPIWLSLIAAAFAVVLSVVAAVLSISLFLIATVIMLAIITLVTVWVLWVVLCAVDISFLAASVSGCLCFVLDAVTNRWVHGTFILGASLIASGLSVLLFPLCRKTLPSLISFTKSFTVECARAIKKAFILIGTSTKNAYVFIISSIKKGVRK